MTYVSDANPPFGRGSFFVLFVSFVVVLLIPPTVLDDDDQDWSRARTHPAEPPGRRAENWDASGDISSTTSVARILKVG
jgi:hypothetical protein